MMYLILVILSITSVSGYYRKAQWIQVGGKNYDFNPAPLSQPDAKKRCIANGGRLFEPRDEKTNRDVFIRAGAELGGATNLWIGISDVGTENVFRYISDEQSVNWKCDGSATTVNTIGCWRVAQPITENTGAAVDGEIPTATVNLDCVFGSPSQDGKWQTSNCNTNVPGEPLGATALAAIAPVTYTFGTPAAIPARFGSICEQAVAPITTTQPPESTTTTKTSDSTCLKTEITLMIGMLFFCYQ
jgi:hypothetical protein